VTDLLAFVDESVRPGRYLLGAVIVATDEAGRLRRAVRKLLLPGQRKLHFKTEGRRRRRELLDALGQLDVEAIVYSCRLSNDVGAEVARSRCVAALVRELQSRRCESELLIESCEQLDAMDGVPGWMRHGYAVTVHKAQGRTCDHGLLLASDDLHREAGYVGLSRGRESNRMYLVSTEPADELEPHTPARDDDAIDPFDVIAQALGRSAAKTLAIEQAEPAPDHGADDDFDLGW